MRYEYVPVEKENIPYRFDIALPIEIFTFEVKYNETHDFFTIDLFKGDETLVLGEKIVYGMPLFDDVYDHRFPAPTIIPWDESGNEQEVTYDNLGETVFLVVDNQ
ncbi:phage baseplate plug family protein [Virgibacillus sediminis]|uniref:Phage baseplate plug protein n=1 Tax=Virgibacillus sediminis TaxID=202260 RepID=A0ABV7A6T0_9BACI